MKVTKAFTLLLLALPSYKQSFSQDTARLTKIPDNVMQYQRAKEKARANASAYPYTFEATDEITTDRRKFPNYEYANGYVWATLKCNNVIQPGETMALDHYNITRGFYSYHQTVISNSPMTMTVHWWNYYYKTNEIVDGITKRKLN